MEAKKLEAQKANGGARAFGRTVLLCPDCGHGIDAHGVDPGGPCGVGDENRVPCPCLMQPNAIASLLIAEAVSS